MDKSPINQLFCFHDTKNYWFYFFREYLELISYCGIVETCHRVNKEDGTQARGTPGCGGDSLPPGDQARAQGKPHPGDAHGEPHLGTLAAFKTFPRGSLCSGQGTVSETQECGPLGSTTHPFNKQTCELKHVFSTLQHSFLLQQLG